MSHPLINRWGSNLFWYNFWYNDKNKNFSINLDYLINQLIFIYVNFGLFFKKNIFFNFYWHLKKDKPYDNSINNYDTKYFRVMEHKNKVTDEITKYTTRIKLKNFYNSKLWILRYQKWLIINLIAYQPVTKKKKKKLKKKHKSYPLQHFIGTNFKTKKILATLRLKIFITFFIKKSLIFKNSYYLF